jgi:hypothetical protein
LYASAPDYDLGVITDAGVVQRITLTMAESGRPAVASVETITQDAGSRSSAERGDRFGAAMSATPFPDELLVGAPGESLGGATGAGAITFWTPGRVQYLHQDSAGIPGDAETGDAFGATIFLGSEVDMAAQRIGEDQAMRLFVSAPFEDVNGLADAGAITQLVLDPPLRQGTHSSVVVSGARSWTQDSAGVAGGAEAGDRFGVSVGSLDLQPSDENGGNIPDPGAPLFVAGAPGEDIEGVVDAGAVLSLGGRPVVRRGDPGRARDSRARRPVRRQTRCRPGLRDRRPRPRYLVARTPGRRPRQRHGRRRRRRRPAQQGGHLRHPADTGYPGRQLRSSTGLDALRGIVPIVRHLPATRERAERSGLSVATARTRRA